VTTRIQQAPPAGDREFPMSERNFRQLQKIAYDLTGINLSDCKQNMIYGRLTRRIRALGMRDFDQYCDLLAQNDSPELGEFVNAITTNLTAFFRENHHFDYLKNTLLPELVRRKQSERRICIWSAGCSTGEEPYSLAMVVRSLPMLSAWNVNILATDLDSNVLKKAQAGEYAEERFAGIPSQYHTYVERVPGRNTIFMREDIRRLVTFKQLNLLHGWPMKGPFDVIFCRNVVIYFDVPTQIKLFDRYATMLAPDGHLFIGHSENLHKISERFVSLGRTIYRRTK
jgi:chemotaxis protein methyltransferase CheR